LWPAQLGVDRAEIVEQSAAVGIDRSLGDVHLADVLLVEQEHVAGAGPRAVECKPFDGAVGAVGDDLAAHAHALLAALQVVQSVGVERRDLDTGDFSHRRVGVAATRRVEQAHRLAIDLVQRGWGRRVRLDDFGVGIALGLHFDGVEHRIGGLGQAADSVLASMTARCRRMKTKFPDACMLLIPL